MSVVIAFFFGVLIQFISRLIFTFDYTSRLKRYGGLWGGIALSVITYFILIKGAKGTSFLTPETVVMDQDPYLDNTVRKLCIFCYHISIPDYIYQDQYS